MNFKSSWKTSIAGAASLIIGALVAFGIFTPDDAATANEALTSMIENVGALIFAIGGIIGLFARDNDVTSESAGAK